MKKVGIDDEISIYGNINGTDISMEKQKVCKIIENFYNLLLKKKMNIEKLGKVHTTQMVFENGKIANGNNEFWMYGYAKKKVDKENGMRYYFKIENIRMCGFFKELQILFNEYLRYFSNNTNDFDIIVEKIIIK